MSRFALFLFLLTVLAVGEGRFGVPQAEAVLTTLSNPIYPKLSRQAHVAGDVELRVGIRKDGAVESVEVISGPAMLRQAALESAQQSQFECRACIESMSTYRMVFTFQLVPTQYGPDCEIKHDATYPQVIQSQNHVTVIDESISFCDPAMTITKVRSVKCLYLWRCGH